MRCTKCGGVFHNEEALHHHSCLREEDLPAILRDYRMRLEKLEKILTHPCECTPAARHESDTNYCGHCGGKFDG